MSIMDQVEIDRVNTRKDTYCLVRQEQSGRLQAWEGGRAWRKRGEVAASGMDSGRNRRGSKDKDT